MCFTFFGRLFHLSCNKLYLRFRRMRNDRKTICFFMFFVKIDESCCTVVQNRLPSARLRPSALRPPVRPSARPSPPVRPSARTGASRTYIHKTPDRPPWAAVTRIERRSMQSGARCEFHAHLLLEFYLGLVPGASPTASKMCLKRNQSWALP